MADPYALPTLDEVRLTTIGTDAARPDAPGFLKTLNLSRKQAGADADWGWNQVNWEAQAEGEAWSALDKAGVKRPATPLGEGDRAVGGLWRQQQTVALAGLVQRLRKADPDLLPDWEGVKDQASFRAMVRRRRKTESDRLGAELQDAGMVPQLLGGLAHGLTDPINFIGLPSSLAVTGTKAIGLIAAAAGKEAAFNAGIGLAIEPLVRRDAEALGIKRTLGDSALDITLQGVAGGVLGGVGKAIEIPVSKALAKSSARDEARAAYEDFDGLDMAVDDDPALVAALLSPNEGHDPVRATRAGTTDTRRLIDDFEALVPPTRQSPDERAAVAVAVREAEVREASPFEPGVAGDDAHFEQLGAALAALEQGDSPVKAVQALIPRIARERGGIGGREVFLAKVRGAESGGDDAARNPRSSAAGRYQFTNATWSSYHRRIYGGDGLADKFDPAKQEKLMAALTADNGRALAGARVPLTSGNYYLAHFAGSGGAIALHRANPAAGVRSVLGDAAVRANPFLKNMTASDAIDWAARKMGRGGDEADAPMVVAAGEAAPIARQPALLEAIGDKQGGVARALAEADEIATGSLPEFDEFPVMRREQYASDDEWLDAQALGGEMYARHPDTDNRDALEAALARRNEAAGGGQNGSRGSGSGRSLVEFIADQGGIEDIGGNLRAMDAQLWHRGGAFRRQLLRARGEDATPGVAISRRHSPDALFAAAIEADYFPQHAGLRDALATNNGYDALPDMDEFFEAIDSELRGDPLYPVGFAGRGGDLDEGLVDAIDNVASGLGLRLDAASADHAIAAIDRGLTPEAAVEEALASAPFRAADGTPLPDGAGFDRPDAPDALVQAASIEHDLRMEMLVEPEITMRIDGDPGSDAVRIDDVLDDIAADEAMAKALRACMAPTPIGIAA